MDCEEFRAQIEADPAELDAESAGHEGSCAACAAYAARVRALEGLIGEALRFDVVAVRRGASPRARKRRALGSAWVALAAAIVGGVAVWIGSSHPSRQDPEEVVAAVLAHWPLEPQSWVVTRDAVARTDFEEIVAPQARVDLDRLGLVSYARLCWVHGRWIPHLVVQGEAGPVMVLLLPSENVGEVVPLALPRAGLKGLVIPLGKGSIAVLGTEQEPLEPLRERITSAVQWNT